MALMAKKMQTLRIIGGKWRSRKITFAALPGVRPTTDATRETLFNWLESVIVGAHCLDLFAGSGALGFEALSRGAASVLMVDKSLVIINKLKENAVLLQAGNLDFLCALIPRDLKKIKDKVFDIVFLDPPFHQNLIKPTCEFLDKSKLLKIGSLVYIEVECDLEIAALLPVNWEIQKQKASGQVKYYLVKVM
jgi:16S rRNA (guanine966-N2)-methyltransferase